MSQSNKPATRVLGAVVATGTLLAGSLFSMQAMAHGHAQAAAKTMSAEGKCGEGKCGEGKCGGDKAKRDASGMASGKRQDTTHTMAGMDTDKDGRLSRAEFAAAHKGSDAKFAGYDGNSDGFVSQAEMDTRHAAMKQGKAHAEGKCGEGKCGSKP